MTLSSIFFKVFVLKFSYWSKFHVNMIDGSRVIRIFFYKESGNWKTPSEFSPISGDWRRLGIPNLARMSLIKCY